MSDGLDRAVIRAGKNFKSRAQRIHRLMVHGVDLQFRRAGRAVEERILFNSHAVLRRALRAAGKTVAAIAARGQMLDERTAERRVDDLRSRSAGPWGSLLFYFVFSRARTRPCRRGTWRAP